MTRIAAFVFAAVLAATASAEGADAPLGIGTIREAGTTELTDLRWHVRPVIVFADTPEDPRFVEQLELLEAELSALAERDVVVLTDSDPQANSPLRLKLRPRGFMLVLIGKDGEVELRKPRPWTVREISRTIDKMPNRQREIQERRGIAG